MEVQAAVPLFVLALFFICMYVHGRLARSKPHPRHLTLYFLMISLGGAIGALLVSLVAPNVFGEFHEMPLAVAATGLLMLFSEYRRSWRHDLRWILVAIATMMGANAWFQAKIGGDVARGRNFYGVLKVIDGPFNKSGETVRSLVHGVVNHGTELLAKGRELEPTTYYAPGSGVGVALAAIDRPGRRIGAVGLGAGTLAAYGRPGDLFRFYEINPLSIRFANEYFHYVPESKGKIEIELGDARLSLERESPEGYDLIALDAFSGDSIPVHLLTVESFKLYLRHLRPDGILAVHISNQHLNLAPVVESVARTVGLKSRRLLYQPPQGSSAFRSEWVLTASDEAWAAHPTLAEAGTPLPPTDVQPWTDDYSNLLRVLR
jgi:hypothetical protein